MQLLTLLFLLGSYVVITTCRQPGSGNQWQLWKKKYNKGYDSLKEENYRYGLWKHNADIVERHNNRVDAGFQMELNMFADQEKTKQTSHKFPVTHKEYPYPQNEIEIPTNIPDSFDWRTKGAVTPVKNQGRLGSVLAYAVTESVESFHIIKTGNLVLLSVLETAQCCAPSRLMPEGVFECIHNIGGLCSEASYPKTVTNGTCHNSSCQAVAQISGQGSVPTGNEEALKASVYKVPVVALIDASHSSFQLYRNGIYYEPNCSSTKLDHAVQIVGYGSKGGNDYWIVRNSWGISWGMDGYILMSRNRKNNCGIATSAEYPV